LKQHRHRLAGPLFGLLALSLFAVCSCKTSHQEPGAPPGMSRQEFLAATQADIDLMAGAEMEGRRSGPGTAAQGEDDTYSLPDSLTREEFFLATQEDLSRAGDEVEGRDTVPMRVPGPGGGVHFVLEPVTTAIDSQITLQDTWITEHRNKAAISISFDAEGMSGIHSIDKGGDDGDVHIGGTSSDVGLPLVVEVMNAKGHPAVALAKTSIDDDTVVNVKGAWRLWCEHPGVPQVQFDTPFDGYPSNPDHVFEIHPATFWETENCLATFKPIASSTKDYVAYDAKKAFTYYESVPCQLEHDDTSHTTTIYTPQARYNYAEFFITPEEAAGLSTGDGYILRCTVLDAAGTKVTGNRRMVFVKGTDAYTAALGLQMGQKLHLLGLPRVNLAVIRWRIRNADQRPEVLTWNLPYEMICVAVL
jgi:hypothetical protein